MEQQPASVHLSEGENVTLSCHIRADEDMNISKVTVEWHRGNENRSHNVKNLSELRGRLQENTNINQHSASLSLSMLKLNDTSKYFCLFFILVDQKMLQHYTNGTNLVVQEELTTAMSILSTTVNTNNNTGNNTGKLYLIIYFIIIRSQIHKVMESSVFHILIFLSYINSTL